MIIERHEEEEDKMEEKRSIFSGFMNQGRNTVWKRGRNSAGSEAGGRILMGAGGGISAGQNLARRVWESSREEGGGNCNFQKLWVDY